MQNKALLWLVVKDKEMILRVVSHIQDFGDATTSPAGDAVIHHWRCKISFRDAHAPHPHSHLQNLGYVTLLQFGFIDLNEESVLLRYLLVSMNKIGN